MSQIGRWKAKLRRWALRRIALPLVNREMERHGSHFYLYVPSTDRLFPYRKFSQRVLGEARTRVIGSDRWYQVLLKKDIHVATAVDIGVNYGYTSCWLSRWADRVFTFEPNPNNLAMVREHLAIRQITNVTLTESAISNTHGEAVLHVKSKDGHHSLSDVGASETVRTITVPVTTLDRAADRLGLDRIGLLKVDVEGFEPQVFEGAAGLLERHAIDLILFEHSPAFYRDRGIDPRSSIATLERFGYRVTRLDGSAATEESLADVWQTDLIAEPSARMAH
ncbi:MAG: FkbM family methyltransferase [Planctomycetota bacterium]